MEYDYKVVGAPEKGQRKRGARTRSDRVAAAFEEVLLAETAEGWEYLRTDLVPVDERTGLFGRRDEVHRAVMVFRRPRRQPAAPPPSSTPPGDELVLSPERRLQSDRRGSEPKIRRPPGRTAEE